MAARAEPVRIEVPEETPEAVATLALDADAKFNAGRLKEAARAYKRALKAGPLDAVLLNNLAASLARLGHLDEAGSALERASSLEPENLIVLENLGMVLAASGRRQEALTVLDRATTMWESMEAGAYPPPVVDVSLWRMVARGKAYWTGGKPKGSKHPLKLPPSVNVADYIVRERDSLRGPD